MNCRRARARSACSYRIDAAAAGSFGAVGR